MLDFEDARERILQHAVVLEPHSVPLAGALGRVLAEDISAPRAMPETDTSAMDGYALCFDDLPPGPKPCLSVSGESRAGVPLGAITRGHACRIFTGAVLPEGADTVVLQEDTDRVEDTVTITERPVRGQHVRPAGSDVLAGSRVLERGRRIGAFELGVLAAADRGQVLVGGTPRVTILSTGDELRAPGSAHRPGSIPESNGPALAALASKAGAAVSIAPLVADDQATTKQRISEALSTSDVLLTVGGVSVGDHDLVKTALVEAGASIEFWKVRIKPGKPLVFALTPHCRVLGLPGNPVSAQLTFALFGLPLLRQMQGATRVLPEQAWATLAAPLTQRPGRQVFHRVTLEGELAHPLSNQSSGSTLSLAHADAVAIVDADSHGADAGTRVPIYRLDRL